MAFVQKNVNASGRIGPDLIELRERAGWTVAEVSRATKISESLIRALEAEAWSEIPDPIYAERILRSYVTFLGGNETYFLQKYRTLLRAKNTSRKLEELLPRPRQVQGFDLVVGSRLLTVLGFLFFVLLLGGYVYFQAHAISTPPPLAVETPEEGQPLQEPLADVRGTTLPETSVM